MNLRRQEWLPAEQLAERSRTALTAMLRHAGSCVPFYRDFCAKAGLDPTRLTWADLRRFPLVDKKTMTAGGNRFHAVGLDGARFLPSSTGGSSGEPFRFFVDRRSAELLHAVDVQARTWSGWRLGDKQAVLWGHLGDHRKSENLSARIKRSLVHRERFINAYAIQGSVLPTLHRELTAFRPRLLLGYASALAFFAEYLRRHRLEFPMPAGIISSAESLTDEFRETIESYFSCPVLDRYGSRELAVIAQQCSPRGGLHVFSDRVHLEILRPDGSPCDPGERGEIVATGLDNQVMPFIRYRTGDLAAASDEACQCGRGYPLLASVEGRTSDLIVGRNGKIVSCPGPRLYGGDIPGIGQMQLVQDRIEEIMVRVVPDSQWSDDSCARLVARIQGLLGDVDVAIELVDAIPPSPSGKYRFTISSVSPFEH
jgi:phenylacetate-CoA ligase